MSKITSLFKRLRGGPTPPARDVRALVEPFAAPAVQLILSSAESRSFFGGTPSLSPGTPWPSRDGRPLMFVASLHLPSLGEVHAFPWLPQEGCLLFFFDVESQPWGFDPKDRGSWAVLHLSDSAETERLPGQIDGLPRRYLEFRRIQTLPSWQRPEIQGLELSDREADALDEIASSCYGTAAEHQVGGYPLPIQGDDMELESQLVSHGIYCGDASGYASAEANDLRSGAADWKLLLQVASDSALALMWGDLGNLYFWVREQDSRAGRFDRAWTILQCH